MIRVLKGVGIAILVPILLFVVLAVLLYMPPVQNWAVRQVAAYASAKTGMQITVEHVNLEFPLDLGVEGVRILQPNDSIEGKTDTVADIRKIVADVQLLPLLRKQVEIDALELSGVKINTTNFVAEARVKGTIGRLSLESHGIDLDRETLRVNAATIEDARVDVALSDTVPPDTTENQNFWKIWVDDLSVKNTDVTVHMPGDTLQVGAYMGNAVAQGGYFDLGKGEYNVQKLDWNDGRLTYDNNFVPRKAEGLDTDHVALSDINIGIDSLSWLSPKLGLTLRQGSLKEKSGVEVTELTGTVALDDKKVYLPDLNLKTTESTLKAHYVMDLNAFDEQHPGKVHATLDGTLGKQDLMRFMADMSQDFKRQWPNQSLAVKGVVTGNMRQVKFDGLNVKLPTAFNLRATGFVTNPTDLDNVMANVDLEARTENLAFLTSLAPKGAFDDLRIPQGIGLKGNVKANGQHYQAALVATEGGGTLKAVADIDAKAMAYTAKVNASNLNPRHFMPSLDAGPFTGNVNLTGSGTDLLSPRTRLQAKADIQHFRYAGYDLDGMKADAHVSNGRVLANVDSRNPLLNGVITVNGLTNTKQLKGTISGDIVKADLYRLGLVDQPMTVSTCLHVDVATDLKDYYKVQGLVSDITIRDSSRVYRPDDLVLDVLTRRDTTHAVVDCGDFHLRADARGGYQKVLEQIDHLTTQLEHDIKAKKIDQAAFRKRLPTASLYLTTGNDNFFVKLLERQGYSFHDADIDLTSSPVTGLNGSVAINKLVADSILLDTVRFYVESDSTNLFYRGQVQNNPGHPQYVFNALFNGYLLEHGTGVDLSLYDERNRLGVKLGAEAEMLDSGIVARLKTDEPILGYKRFEVNEDNYIFMGNDRRISAKMDLKADDGQGVQVYTNDENHEALQDLTLSLHQFDLEKVLSVLPYMPAVTGIMNGDFHVIQTKEDFSVSSSLAVNNLTYERSPMGNLSTEFVYVPKGDGTHYVDGILFSDGREVGTLVGTYNPAGKGNLDATLSMERLPLSLLNGFIPDQLFGFQGYGEGDLSIKGALSRPQVNGEINMDSCYLVSVPYGISMRFSDKPVRIVGSNLVLENFELYAYNENPLIVNGSVDFSNLDRIPINMRMRAQNFQLINAKENMKSVAFGKAFINFFGGMTGTLENLRMRGKIDVLGSTDMSYILRDSPLTTDNQLDELVKFTDFSDTTATIVSRPVPSGLDLDMTIEVKSGAHVMAYLNTDKSNYVDLMGGGTLRMQYNSVDDLQLRGRYTLSNGEMKYSLPIIPLKTFTIQDGSYIEFTGEPMNPTLNITATERTKATVSNTGGVGRSVEFDCGVVITKTLEDMGLEFTLDAPEDQSLHSELQSMSAEQRGKLAVTMLTTGMYLADGNTNAFSMNSALSSFLNTEINKVTGTALRTLDLSFGMDNTTDASGSEHTDYSFKFAKRFWNNRLKISVGGKVSTGSDVTGQNQSFFDNVTFEYRLDETANKYMKLFYENNSYDWLEGYTQEYGVGFIWRRSLYHFRDVFNLKNDGEQQLPPPVRRDSVENEQMRNGENEKKGK